MSGTCTTHDTLLACAVGARSCVVAVVRMLRGWAVHNVRVRSCVFAFVRMLQIQRTSEAAKSEEGVRRRCSKYVLV